MNTTKFTRLFPFVALIVLIFASLACGGGYMPLPYVDAGFGNPDATQSVKPTSQPVEIQPTPASQAPANTPMSEPTLATNEFPLKGLRFPAMAGGVKNESYDLFVEANGRLWEKWLPATGKVAHSVAFELPEGDYVFNGVVARLYLDETHNGKGSSNPLTVGGGNDLKFSVKLPAGATYTTAWVLVESDGGAPSGFDIWYLGPLAAK